MGKYLLAWILVFPSAFSFLFTCSFICSKGRRDKAAPVCTAVGQRVEGSV